MFCLVKAKELLSDVEDETDHFLFALKDEFFLDWAQEAPRFSFGYLRYNPAPERNKVYAFNLEALRTELKKKVHTVIDHAWQVCEPISSEKGELSTCRKLKAVLDGLAEMEVLAPLSEGEATLCLELLKSGYDQANLISIDILEENTVRVVARWTNARNQYVSLMNSLTVPLSQLRSFCDSVAIRGIQIVR